MFSYILTVLHNCLNLSCYVGPYTRGFSCNCNLARLLVTGAAIGVVANSLLEFGQFGGSQSGSAQKNQAFTSSYFYLQLGFQHFQAFGDFDLTAVVPPLRLAFRQPMVRVYRQWRR